MTNKDADSSPSDSGCCLWQSTCAECPVCTKPGISLTALQEGKGLDGKESTGERSPLYCMPETSLGYTLSQTTNKQTNKCMAQDQVYPVGLRTAQLLALCGKGLVQALAWL